MNKGTPRIAVGFDFDHTLGIDNKLERVAFLHLLESFPRQDLTLAQETEHIDALLAQQRSGAFTIDDAVEQYARGHGVKNDLRAYIERFKKFALEGVDDFIVPLPGLREMLDALHRADVPTAILSNGWSPLQDRKAQCIGFAGPVLVSDCIGAQKPDSRAFAVLLETLGASPDATWYVGDNAAVDVAGSTSAGLRSVWLSEGGSYPGNLPTPEASITDLRELLTVLSL
ncbi:MAG: HAD family hydrolase [Candidatus Eremiobacteraeota bacterium]|nr:HAD family hydrolase [Candidatus Eremiobacteraeota bacterium]